MPLRLQYARQSMLSAHQVCADLATELNLLDDNWPNLSRAERLQHRNGMLEQLNRLELHIMAVRTNVRHIMGGQT